MNAFTCFLGLRKSSWPYLILALLIYFSWVWPGSTLGVAFVFAAALALAKISRQGQKVPLKSLYCAGVVVNILGFYWLANTVGKFGGFPPVLSWLIFAFFVGVSSLQFSLFGFLLNRLPATLGNLRLALSWVSAEFLFPRIFPWELAHPLIGLPILAQLADIAGTPLLSFVLLVCAQLTLSLFDPQSRKSQLKIALLLCCLLGLWGVYGSIRLQQFEAPQLNPLRIALIQANVAVVQKGDIATLEQNEARYIELSKALPSETELIIWPESVIQDWMSIDTKHVANDPRLPYFGPQHSLLTGALTFETQERFFNSAVLITKEGLIPAPYHKRILMPFGEYMPFSWLFPALNNINANLAQFTAGAETRILEIPRQQAQERAVKIAPLICYEDLIPRLSRSATKQGAEVLINLTNDGWFGDGPAAVHHNLIASFRAIENRRFLIRATNTGTTDIIDPRGISRGQIAPNSEGTLIANIYPRQEMTIFVDLMDTWIWWAVSGLVLLLAILKNRSNQI